MSDEEYDSDTMLQELYALGKIKPGLNIPVEKKVFINDTTGIEEKLKQLTKQLPWIEVMHTINDCAPIAAELSVEVQEKEDFVKSGRSDTAALNEFKRESLFHRQAQAAVMEGVPKIKAAGVKTIRPDDNFAEMMKSDEHMQKIRQSLLKRQAGLEISEKVKKLRMEKKLAKQKQIESTLRKQEEKKKLAEEIKKYRKGVRKDLDMLDSNPKKRSADDDSAGFKRVNKKRQMKNQKFGFGGKKRGMKNNQFPKGNRNVKKRPGKSRRQKNKKN